uniref:Alpha-carbonic anhydrase domain-containing protein n=1 Tax=Sinocyclocheilus grahami TaxID=75366 RepID=A0A672K2T8_SINGR
MKNTMSQGVVHFCLQCDDPLIYTGWAATFPECQERNQSPINIADQDTKVSMEYQELTLDGFDAESSNKTSMKNTGKTALFKDKYLTEKVEFHWGQSNGSDGSEHSINGRRFPVEVSPN